jgi:hypothetical protein
MGVEASGHAVFFGERLHGRVRVRAHLAYGCESVFYKHGALPTSAANLFEVLKVCTLVCNCCVESQ